MPAEAISLAVIDAFTVVELITVVTLLLPFHSTAAPLRKPLPVTVSTNPGEPAIAELAERAEMAGVVGLLASEKLAGVDMPTTVAVTV